MKQIFLNMDCSFSGRNLRVGRIPSLEMCVCAYIYIYICMYFIYMYMCVYRTFLF